MAVAGSGGDDKARARARAGIRGWVSRNEVKLRQMTPQAILTGMTAAAFAPVLVPLIASADTPAMQALLRQFGGAGAGYLAAVVQQFADQQGKRPLTPAMTEERLGELLHAGFTDGFSGANSAQTQAAISDLVLGVKGVDVLLHAAAESDEAGLLSHLVRALAKDPALMTAALGVLDSLRESLTGLRDSQRDIERLPGQVLLEIGLLRHELVRRPLAAGEAARAARSSPVPAPRPYPGLAPFEEDDAPWFFGRSGLIVELVNALDERVYGSMPLVVAGVSGAGKSSVLRAGLIPDLKAGGLTEPGSADWPVRVMRPDRHPLVQLSTRLGELARLVPSDVYDQLMVDPTRASMIAAQGLLTRKERHRGGITPVGAVPNGGIGRLRSRQRRLVLVIDQFEEAFTRCHDEEERRVFIDALCALASGSRDEPPTALVVIGLQIAFMEQCTAHPELRPALDRPVIVGPMTADELEDAIVLPAERAELTVQAGLVRTMLSDIGAVESRANPGQLTYDPGALPLLAHALFETWQARDGRELTIAAYQAAGGVRGALAKTAEGLLKTLDTDERQTLRRLLVYHLVTAAEFTEDARRHISRDALLGELPEQDRERAGLVLNRLAAARLLSADSGGVQVAHEALLRHWPTLAGWLAKERDRRREAQRVFEQARAWDEQGRNPDLLPRGTALAIIEDKIANDGADGPGKPGGLGGEFLDAARHQAHRTRVHRRAQRFGVVAAVIAVVAVVVTFLLVSADQQKNLAIAQSDAATSQLTQSAQNANDPVTSLLLDVEAYRVGGTTADNGLLSAQADFFTSTLSNPGGAGRAIAFDMGASLLAVAGQGEITVFQATTHKEVRALPGGSPFYAVAFNASGTLLAGAEQNGVTVVWEVETWRRVAVLGKDDGLSVNAVAFQPHGSLIATAGISGVVTLWNEQGHRVLRLQAGVVQDVQDFQDDVTINGIAFSPDGTRLAAASSDRTVRLWNLHGKPSLVMLTGHSGPVRAVAFNPQGTLLASADDEGAIRLWNGRTGTRLGTLPGGGTQQVGGLAFNPQGTLLASGGKDGADGAVRLWDLATKAQVAALTGPSSRVTGLAFSRNGQTIASVEADPTVGFWNVNTPAQPGTGSIAAVATAATLRTPIATLGGGTSIGLWNPDPAASYAIASLPTPLAVNIASSGDIPPSVALSPGGATMAAPLRGREVGLWSTSSGHEIGLLHAPQSLASVAYSPAADGPILAGGGSDGIVYLWPPGATQPTPVNANLASPITSLAFSPTGRLLAAGAADGTFLLATRGADGRWTPIPPPTVPLDGINTVALSADGTLLATGSASGTVRLWDVKDPYEPANVASMTGPAGQIVSVAFSGDGMLAASADDDSIRVWGTEKPTAPTLEATFTGLASRTSVGWEPGTQTLVGAGPDGTLLTWDTDPSHVASRICHALASHAAGGTPIAASMSAACPPAKGS